MAVQVTTISCPSCGGTVDLEKKQCEYCGNALMISTFNSVDSMTVPEIGKHIKSYQQALVAEPEHKELNTSVAMCFLKLKMYDKALPCFEKAMEDNFDNSEVFFYAAVALLQGKKAFLTQRAVIDKIEEYIQAAIMIEPKGIYYYFWAYIRQDHHYRKGYMMNPNYKQLYAQAQQAGLSRTDVAALYSILGVTRPECL